MSGTAPPARIPEQVRVTVNQDQGGSMRYGSSITALVSLSVALTACDSDATGPGRKSPSSEPLEVMDGTNLGEYVAPVRSDAAGHSFVGAVYDRALAAVTDDVTDGGAHDLVTTDDFIYGEPQPQ